MHYYLEYFFRKMSNLDFAPVTPQPDEYLPWAEQINRNAKQQEKKSMREKDYMSQPNIDYASRVLWRENEI